MSWVMKIIIKLNLTYHQKLYKSCGRTSGELSVKLQWNFMIFIQQFVETFPNVFKFQSYNKQTDSITFGSDKCWKTRRKRLCVVRNVFFAHNSRHMNSVKILLLLFHFVCCSEGKNFWFWSPGIKSYFCTSYLVSRIIALITTRNQSHSYKPMWVMFKLISKP